MSFFKKKLFFTILSIITFGFYIHFIGIINVYASSCTNRGGACVTGPICNANCGSCVGGLGCSVSGYDVCCNPGPPPACNQGGCGGWNYPANTCYGGNAVQYCQLNTYNGSSDCTVVNIRNVSTINACYGGWTCRGGTCIPPCNGTKVCNTCTPPANTCNNGNGLGSNCHWTTYPGYGGNCIVQSAPNQAAYCTINNCNASWTCIGGSCIPPCNGTKVCNVCTPPVNTCNNGNGLGSSCNWTTYPGYGGNCVQQSAPNQAAYCTINNCSANFTCGGGICRTTISGTVWESNNINSSKKGYAGLVVTASGGYQATTNGNGQYTITGVPIGTYTVSITVPVNYLANAPTSQTVTITNTNGNITGVDFGIIPDYKGISGNIFLDNLANGRYTNPPDTLYGGTATVTMTGPTNKTVTTTNGTYATGTVLFPGTYTVSFSPPNGYYMMYPLNGVPSSFQVVIGAGCSVNSNDGSCQNNSVINLNFGINNVVPWEQSICGDVRTDAGATDPLPVSPTCGGYTGSYMVNNNASCTRPGMVFTGNTNANFGNNNGQAAPNPYNRVVGGVSNPEIYQPPTTHLARTSYQSVLQKAQQAGITPVDLATVCTLANCTLPGNLAHGIYQANGNVLLQGYTFPNAQNYVILVNGTLTINGNITVPVGSTATFTASGNIVVNSNVGGAATSTASNIEGVYSTDKSFIVNSTGAGTCTDQRLNIAGTVITNAALTGGSFQNNRDLCTNNPICPSVAFFQRPDLILNTPILLQYATHIWQEIVQ